MDENTVTLRKRQRQALRMNCKKETQKANDIIEIDSDDVAAAADTIIGKIKYYQDKLADIDEQILASILDEDQAMQEASEATQYGDELLETVLVVKNKINLFTKTQKNEQMSVSVVHTPNVSFAESKIPSVKLPKLDIEQFGGDPLSFQSFWDSFQTTIHENENLSDVDKFKYLRLYLTGDALTTVTGYRMTSDNYKTVVEALTERYGNKQLAVFSHFEALLALPAVTNYNIQQLQSVYDNCEMHIRSLIALGLKEDTFGQVFTPIILSKLPQFVKMDLHRKQGSDPWTLTDLRKLLKDEIRVRDMSQRNFGSKSTEQNTSSKNNNNRSKNTNSSNSSTTKGTSAALLTNEKTDKKAIKCSFCSDTHYSDQCKKFVDLPSRKEKLKGRCFKCLSTKHIATNCESTINCFYCKKNTHHRSLCPKKFGDKNSSASSLTVEANTVPTTTNITSSLLSHGERVVLQTALAPVRSSQNKIKKSCRLLFDTGGSRTFITAKVAKTIGARIVGEEVVSIAGFSDNKRKTVNYKIAEFEVIQKDGSAKKLTANITPVISCPIQKLPLDKVKNPILHQLVLAEPVVDTTESVEIDILIGNDYYYDFVGKERINCSDGLLLLESSLGFIATGRIKDSVDSDKSVSSLLLTKSHPADPYPQIEKFWSLEDIGVKTPLATNDDEEAQKAFNATIKFKEGRYEVSWPWKSSSSELPENYQLAYGRLKSLLKRIGGQKDVFDLYNQTIQDQEKKGIIERAPEQPTSDKVHYLPHHCVITPGKTTTKLRVVYDASAKAGKEKPSLNECLHRGPVLLDDLCGLLLRFRLNKIGITSDIEKAFLQVALSDDSRDVTRFLWIVDSSLPPVGDNLIVYRFCRVPFGTLSSPFLLGGTVQHHIEQSSEPVAKEIEGNMYVDNVLKSEQSVEKAIRFYKGAKTFFNEASMNLREWFTNSPELVSVIEEKDRGKDICTKVLGLTWNTEKDTLSCSSFGDPTTNINTKRLMLKYLAKVFDPCGFFSAVTISGKILIQKLWMDQFKWDDVLPDAIVKEWSQISQQLQQIPLHTLPRYYGVQIASPDAQLSLHCFCDASSKAYAAVVYLRSQIGDNISTILLFAKSRVAPVKELSIPRLELMAMLIGVRVTVFVREQLRVLISKVVIWSDSQCVLHWLNKTNIGTVFVKNRVNEIRSHDNIEYRYVPTEQNPADLASRGCTIDNIVNNDTWWHGPSFLVRAEDGWPKGIQSAPDKDPQPPESTNPVLVSTDQQTDPSPVIDIRRFSKLGRLLRVTAWVKRFIKNARAAVQNSADVVVETSKSLTLSEICEAEHFWEGYIQKQHFPMLFDSPNKHKLGKQLDIFVDETGILRCGGRLRFTKISADAKHPKLLPKNCHFTDLVIADCHEKVFHNGVAHTLSQVRKKYWVIHGRGQVKRIRRACRLCNMQLGPPFKTPPFPPLPDFRITQQKPFSRVGVDYFGPLLIKTPDGLKKAWVCLFTCAVVRAVHLEAVEELSAEQFLLCLRRFAAIRRAPDLIVSDNAKHFHKASKLLQPKKKHPPSIEDYATMRGIEWKFITAFGPWMGGFYERMVGIVKRALKSSLDKKLVSFIELQTVLCEVAAVVNSRPLVYSEADLSEPPITPSHFLGGPCDVLPQSHPETLTINNNVTGNNLILQYKRIQNALQQFWQKWHSEYLLNLRAGTLCHKQRTTSENIPKVGTVVLIKDKLPRSCWKIAKISELLRSADGVYTSAALQLPNKTAIQRPLRLLFPLEMCYDDVDTTTKVDNGYDSDASGVSVELLAH